MKEKHNGCCGTNFRIDHIQSQTTITDYDGRACRPDIVIWVKVKGEWKAVVLELKSYEDNYLPAKCVDQTCRYRNNLTKFNGYNCECIGAIICCSETTKMIEAFQKNSWARNVTIKYFDPDPKSPNYGYHIENIMKTVTAMFTKTEELKVKMKNIKEEEGSGSGVVAFVWT